MKRIILTIILAAFSFAVSAQITNVNIGSAPNSGNGDPVRTAFSKVNENDNWLEAQIDGILDGDTNLPVATTSAFGVVKPDGTTITISSGVISATGGGGSGLIIGPAGDYDASRVTNSSLASQNANFPFGAGTAVLEMSGTNIVIGTNTVKMENILTNVSSAGLFVFVTNPAPPYVQAFLNLWAVTNGLPLGGGGSGSGFPLSANGDAQGNSIINVASIGDQNGGGAINLENGFIQINPGYGSAGINVQGGKIVPEGGNTSAGASDAPFSQMWGSKYSSDSTASPTQTPMMNNGGTTNIVISGVGTLHFTNGVFCGYN